MVDFRESVLANLRQNRRLTVVTSLASGAVALVPLPIAPELALSAIRSGLVSAIARRRGLPLSRGAAPLVAGAEPAALDKLFTAALLAAPARLPWTRLARALLVFARFQEVNRTFLTGTCFDHYCAFHHPAKDELTAEKAARLGRTIQLACDEAPALVIAALLRRAASNAARAGALLPRSLWELATTLLRSGDDEAERVVEEDVRGVFSRLTSFVEAELQETGRISLEAIYLAFEMAWSKASAAE